MKYLLSIFSILTAITAITLFYLWPEQRNDNSDAVVTINGRTLTKRFFQNQQNRNPDTAESKNYVKTIVTKQLLIAEAQRRHIDQQPEFRLALKTVYENSLIELLLKEVKDEIQTPVSAEEVNSYLQAFGKTYTFYVMETPQLLSIDHIKRKGAKHVSRFDELNSTLRQTLSSMNPGTATIAYASSNDKIAIYLEKIEGETTEHPDFDVNKIKQQLQLIKAEKQVNAWIDSLHSQATISYHINQE